MSGKKKEPKPKLFGPDILRWGGGQKREGVGAKKFGMSLETQGNQTFWAVDIPGFCRDIPEWPEKLSRDFAGISQSGPKSLRTRKFVFIFWPLTWGWGRVGLRTGKHSNPQNRARIHQVFTKKKDSLYFRFLVALLR